MRAALESSPGGAQVIDETKPVAASPDAEPPDLDGGVLPLVHHLDPHSLLRCIQPQPDPTLAVNEGVVDEFAGDQLEVGERRAIKRVAELLLEQASRKPAAGALARQLDLKRSSQRGNGRPPVVLPPQGCTPELRAGLARAGTILGDMRILTVAAGSWGVVPKGGAGTLHAER